MTALQLRGNVKRAKVPEVARLDTHSLLQLSEVCLALVAILAFGSELQLTTNASGNLYVAWRA